MSNELATPKKTTKKIDIRPTLPTAIKGGTGSKPVWTIEGKNYVFRRPLNKQGQGPDRKKANPGSNGVLAVYTAGSTKTGKDLLFVGLFGPMKEKKVKRHDQPIEIVEKTAEPTPQDTVETVAIVVPQEIEAVAPAELAQQEVVESV